MTKYFLISGFDFGEPISYVINNKDNDLEFHLRAIGDSSRYYKEISKEEFIELGGVENESNN